MSHCSSPLGWQSGGQESQLSRALLSSLDTACWTNQLEAGGPEPVDGRSGRTVPHGGERGVGHGEQWGLNQGDGACTLFPHLSGL